MFGLCFRGRPAHASGASPERLQDALPACVLRSSVDPVLNSRVCGDTEPVQGTEASLLWASGVCGNLEGLCPRAAW